MDVTKHSENQDYFTMPGGIWFPDLEERIAASERHYANYPAPFICMTCLLAYFRRELSRAQFVSQFLNNEPPKKSLKKDHDAYLQVKALCIAYRDQTISAPELDENLLLSFRNRPTDDVFSPAVEDWEETVILISQLTQKQNSLPFHFDGIAWHAYLTGRVTRKEYAEHYLTMGVWDHLSCILVYGKDKKEFAEKYASEISVCKGLHALCLEYKNGEQTPESFESQFVELAKKFCEDISQSHPEK